MCEVIVVCEWPAVAFHNFILCLCVNLLKAGRTALICSAAGGHLVVTQLLLDRGANPNVADSVSILSITDHWPPDIYIKLTYIIFLCTLLLLLTIAVRYMQVKHTITRYWMHGCVSACSGSTSLLYVCMYVCIYLIVWSDCSHRLRFYRRSLCGPVAPR